MDISGENMVRKSPEIIPLLGLTSSVPLLLAAL